jgi:hypothetical protein
MEIRRAGSQPSGEGSAERFTGTVRIDPLFSPLDPARVAGASPAPAPPGMRITLARKNPAGESLHSIPPPEPRGANRI